MKKFILSVVVALCAAVMPAFAQHDGPTVYVSESLLSFVVPDNTREIQDDDEMIHVETPDHGFSVAAIPVLYEDFADEGYSEEEMTEFLGVSLAKMAANAGIDLSKAGRLQIENDDIVGEVFAARDENGLLFVYSICANDERCYLIQVCAHPDYEPFVDAMFDTISIEEEE